MKHSPDRWKLLGLQLLVIAAGCIGVGCISMPAAGILLGVSVSLLLLQNWFLRRRQQRISALCDDIDNILHGRDSVRFDAYAEGELGILSAELQKMTVRLREQNAALQQDRQFMKEALEDMSHQLRTPLTSMLLIIEMLRTENRREHLQELRSLVARMQWMLETLLNLSRLEAGAVTFQTETLHVSELLQAALEPISISIELKAITLRTELEGDPVLQGDRQYCTEALVNLLKNCMEHTPEGGTITIHAEQNSIYTGIRITDSGEGIPAEDLPHIFERFYRGSQFSKKGYGIGLAFARKIIVSQNGSLQVRNAMPHGAEFDLRFYRTVV